MSMMVRWPNPCAGSWMPLEHAHENLLYALAREEHFGVVIEKGVAHFPSGGFHSREVWRRIAGMIRSIKMKRRSKEIYVGELDHAGVSMVTASELRINCGCISNALVVRQFDGFVGWFANDGIKGGEDKSGTDVVEARSSHCHAVSLVSSEVKVSQN